MLINVAYRMLGSAADATDAVQEGLARWYAMSAPERAQVTRVRAWLITTVSRICLDTLRSARVRREAYFGEWLPVPVPVPSSENASPTNPLDKITLDESVGMALLVVFEKLTPAERVVFVLHDIFNYRFKEVAAVVGRTPESCRQLAGSARRRLQACSVPRRACAEDRTVVPELKRAWLSGDLLGLIALLDPRVSATADGGGQVSAVVRPVVGAVKVAKLLLGVAKQHPGIRLEVASVNGEAGLIVRDASQDLMAVLAVSIVDHRLEHLWIIRNPEKLSAWRR